MSPNAPADDYVPDASTLAMRDALAAVTAQERGQG